MNTLKYAISMLIILFAAISCSDDSESFEPIVENHPFDDGYFVTNEGPFSEGNGSISFIASDFSIVNHEIFKTVNQEPLGNIVQSMVVGERLAFIIVNGSGQIVVVNKNSFEWIATVDTELDNPRYGFVDDEQLYVTFWGDPLDESDDAVVVYDINTMIAVKQIPVAFGPERIASLTDNRIYIAHKGGWGYNNKITVINTVTDVAGEVIEVGDVPGSLDFDAEGNLWVLCEGIPAWTGTETQGSLIKINSATNEIETRLDFSSGHPMNFTADGNIAFFTMDDKVFRMDLLVGEIPDQPVMSGIYTYNLFANSGNLFMMDAKDFNSRGELFVYDTQSLEERFTSVVGVIPGGVYVNK